MMSEFCGTARSVADIHAAAHRLEAGAARTYDDLGAAAQAHGALDAAKVWRGLAAAARRRARLFAVDGAPPAAPREAMDPAALAGPAPTPWQAMEVALAVEYGALTTLRMLATLADDDDARDEANRLAERKRQHLTELGQRQGKLATEDTPA